MTISIKFEENWVLHDFDFYEFQLTKQRKHRSVGINKKDQSTIGEVTYDNRVSGYIPATANYGYNSDSGVK